jgi:hypothetical protein
MQYINTGSFIIISLEAEFSIFLCIDYLQILAPWVSVADDLAFHSLGQPILDEGIQVRNHSMEI